MILTAVLWIVILWWCAKYLFLAVSGILGILSILLLGCFIVALFTELGSSNGRRSL